MAAFNRCRTCSIALRTETVVHHHGEPGGGVATSRVGGGLPGEAELLVHVGGQAKSGSTNPETTASRRSSTEKHSLVPAIRALDGLVAYHAGVDEASARW